MATPVDEDKFNFHQGIHERLDIAEKMGGYFGADGVTQFGMKSVLETNVEAPNDVKAEGCTVTLSQSESVSSFGGKMGSNFG